MFLTNDELRELTGLKQRAALKRWLQKRRIKFTVDKEGWPIKSGAVLVLFHVKQP